MYFIHDVSTESDFVCDRCIFSKYGYVEAYSKGKYIGTFANALYTDLDRYLALNSIMHDSAFFTAKSITLHESQL